MCEVLSSLLATIVVLAIDPKGLSMCSQCIMILNTDKKKSLGE